MTYDFQLTVDATAPHDLADWWAETLRWQVEPQDAEFIRRMVEQGHASEADTTTHRGALVWRAGAAIVHPGTGQRVLFQAVPEGKPDGPTTDAPVPVRRLIAVNGSGLASTRGARLVDRQPGVFAATK
jgi:hypothetical protein